MVTNPYLKQLSESAGYWWTDTAEIDTMDEAIENGATGVTTNLNDAAAINAKFESAAPGAVIKCYEDAEGNTYDNYYTILLGPVDFNDYL